MLNKSRHTSLRGAPPGLERDCVNAWVAASWSQEHYLHVTGLLAFAIGNAALSSASMPDSMTRFGGHTISSLLGNPWNPTGSTVDQPGSHHRSFLRRPADSSRFKQHFSEAQLDWLSIYAIRICSHHRICSLLHHHFGLSSSLRAPPSLDCLRYNLKVKSQEQLDKGILCNRHAFHHLL